MWDKIRSRFQQFADRTTIQGIYEMYYAKSLFDRLFWLILVIASNVLTGVLVYSVLMQYQNQNSITQAQRLPKGRLYYPPIKLCYPFWLNWIDFEKVAGLNISKEVLLYGTSYLINVYISSDFNMSLLKSEFETVMNLHGLATVSEFFELIKHDQPPGLFSNLVFNKTEFNYDYSLCYIANVTHSLMSQDTTESLNNGGNRQKLPDSKKSVYLYLVPSLFSNDVNVTKIEYSSYIYKFLSQKFRYAMTPDNRMDRITFLNQSNSSEQLYFYPTLYLDYYSSGIPLSQDAYSYEIKVSVNVHKWKNNEGGVECKEGQQMMTGDNSNCFDNCYANYFGSKPCSCPDFFSAQLITNDTTENLCNYCMYSMEDVNETCIGNKPADNFVYDNCSTEVKGYKLGNCTGECENVTKGCEVWEMDTVIKSLTYSEIEKKFVKNSYVIVTITYPTENGIFVVSDEDALSWEEFVSSVGGLLGIWMGASILSYVQILHLCFCGDCDCTNLSKEKDKTTNEAKGLKIKKRRVHPVNNVKKNSVGVNT